MNRINRSLVLFSMIFLTSWAWGWNCSVPGQIRVEVPSSYTGSGTGDGNNQVVSQGGLNFVCETLPTTSPSTPTSTSNSNATSASNSASNSTSGASSNATGGNATATGGQGGNSTSKSGVSNSGNSTNNVTSTLTGGNQKQQQSQTQANTSTNSNQSAGGSVSNVGNSVTNVAASKIPVASAYAPTTLPSAPCVKNGFGAGAQTMVVGGSFGQGGRIDAGCDARENARAFFLAGSRLAGCKMLVSTKAAKKAGVTLEDCMTSPEQKPEAALIVPDPIPAPAPQPVIEIQNNIPPAQIVLLHEEMTVTAPRPKVVKHVQRVHKPCPVTPIQNQCAVVREK